MVAGPIWVERALVHVPGSLASGAQLLGLRLGGAVEVETQPRDRRARGRGRPNSSVSRRLVLGGIRSLPSRS